MATMLDGALSEREVERVRVALWDHIHALDASAMRAASEAEAIQLRVILNDLIAICTKLNLVDPRKENRLAELEAKLAASERGKCKA